MNQGTYTYDAFEWLRVRVVANQTPTTNNGTVHYVWDIFGNIIAEANGSTGATLREMVYLEGMPLNAIDVAASPKKIYAVHVDHLNRPVMLTDAAKVNVWSASFEPFGKVRTVTGTVTQNLGLPGQWFQLEHGLAYNWHRHYDPTTGRYTTADPLGFVDGPSVFAYVGSAPHSEVDPTGTQNARVTGPRLGVGNHSSGQRPFEFNYRTQINGSWYRVSSGRVESNNTCTTMTSVRDGGARWPNIELGLSETAFVTNLLNSGYVATPRGSATVFNRPGSEVHYAVRPSETGGPNRTPGPAADAFTPLGRVKYYFGR